MSPRVLPYQRISSIRTAPSDGDHDRRPDRAGAGQQEAERHAGHRDVADAVAHERLAALDEVDADGGGGDADQDGGEQGPLHEGVVEDSISSGSPVRRAGRTCGVVAPRAGGDVVVAGQRRAGRRPRGGGPSWTTQPSRSTTARSISGSSGPSSCRTSRTVAPRATWSRRARRSDLLAGQVDAGHRLVHDQQLGFAGQRAGDQHPLVLAAGQGVDAGPWRGRPCRPAPGRVDGGPVGLAQGRSQRRAGQAARRRRPRGRSRGRRWRRWCAAVRSRCGASRGSAGEGCRTGGSSPAASWPRPISARTRSTCRSRWRRAARRPRRGGHGEVDAAQHRAEPSEAAAPRRRSTGSATGVAVSRSWLGSVRHCVRLTCAERRLQGREVASHDLEVVVAWDLSRDALERVEDVRLQARGRPRASLRRLVAASVSKKTVVMSFGSRPGPGAPARSGRGSARTRGRGRDGLLVAGRSARRGSRRRRGW